MPHLNQFIDVFNQINCHFSGWNRIRERVCRRINTAFKLFRSRNDLDSTILLNDIEIPRRGSAYINAVAFVTPRRFELSQYTILRVAIAANEKLLNSGQKNEPQ